MNQQIFSEYLFCAKPGDTTGNKTDMVLDSHWSYLVYLLKPVRGKNFVLQFNGKPQNFGSSSCFLELKGWENSFFPYAGHTPFHDLLLETEITSFSEDFKQWRAIATLKKIFLWRTVK